LGDNVAVGPGLFQLIENALVNLSGNFGMALIAEGDSIIIDKTPPTKFSFV
jgi:hypothetical protein